MAAKGLDIGDKVLAKAIAGRLIHALRQQWRRGLIYATEKYLGRECGRCRIPIRETRQLKKRAAVNGGSNGGPLSA